MKETKSKNGNDAISYVDTVGGTSDAFGDIDAAASLEQVPCVYPGAVSSAPNRAAQTMQAVSIHQSSGEQMECAGSLIKPGKAYSTGELKDE